MDSLHERQEERCLFSDQLNFTLNKLYPASSGRVKPAEPSISTEKAVVRALSLMTPLPLEKPDEIVRHMNCISTICRLYPPYARAFLEGGVLAQSALKAVSDTREWNDKAMDKGGEVLQFWRALLPAAAYDKAFRAINSALEAGFMDRFSFIALRSQNDEDVGEQL